MAACSCGTSKHAPHSRNSPATLVLAPTARDRLTHADAVLAVAVHPSKPLLASAAHERDKTVKIWLRSEAQ